MAARARNAGVALRPHAKTHKSPTIARAQRLYGAQGLTVATVQEAECFANAGFDDLLVTSPPVGTWRLKRLGALARSAQLRVVLDSIGAVEELEAVCAHMRVEIGYLWEVDVGTGRCGTAPGDETTAAVKRAVASSRATRFDGLMSFAGHAYGARNSAELADIAQHETNVMVVQDQSLKEIGIPCRVLSVGSTPTSHYLVGEGTSLTEIRPGNYVFYDATQVALGLVPKERCALSVLATVISAPGSDRIILDSGSKALAAERLTPRSDGFGLVLEHDGMVIERLYEEHAIVRLADPDGEVHVGDRLHIVPNHACAAANLHAAMIVLDETGAVADIWPVAARGWTDDYAVPWRNPATEADP